jgi:hypothetical protein
MAFTKEEETILKEIAAEKIALKAKQAVIDAANAAIAAKLAEIKQIETTRNTQVSAIKVS